MATNPLYITSLHLVGYKSIRNAEITFHEGLNIIIGKNGGGKTNLLDFLNAVLNHHIYFREFEFDYDKMIRVKVNDYCEFPMEFSMDPFTQEGLAR